MVAPVPNLTRVVGTVKARSPHPTLPGWDLVRLEVTSTEPVPGMADLLTGRIGSDLEIAVRQDLLPESAIGRRLACRAKRTPAGAMCEPNPAAGQFAVSTASGAG